MIVYSPPTSCELYEQAVGRVYRSGQTRPVLVQRLLADKTIEEPLYKLLDRKVKSQAEFLLALAGRKR